MVHVIGTYLPRALSYLVWDPLWRMSEREKVVYLTFDDGPEPDITPQLLDLFDRYQAGATFFLRGDHAEQCPQLTRNIIAAGHTLGNHTYSHVNAWKISSEELESELQRATDVITDITGCPLCYMRPPFGRITPRGLIWCKHAGQKMVMWDVLPGDFAPQVTAEHVEQWTRTRIRPGSIVCLHDNPKSRAVTPAAMERLLPRLIDEGWSLQPLPYAEEVLATSGAA